MTLEERVAKCRAYCRFLQNHGVVWVGEDNRNRAVGMISADWVISCLDGQMDEIPDLPYFIEGCDCPACINEQARASALETSH